MSKTFDIRLRRGRGRSHRVDNALNRLAAEDGPATLRVQLQCYLPRRRNQDPGRQEYQRIGATFLVDCRNTAALAYVRRQIRECLRKLDHANIAEQDAENDLGQATEEVQAQEADYSPLVEARKAEIMAATRIGGSRSGPKDRRMHPPSEATELRRIAGQMGACYETASPISPTAQSTIAPQANIAASCCPACGQLLGSNALACFECLTARARIARGGI